MPCAAASAAILAGGRASRFGGRDKCRLLVGGRPIVTRQLDVLRRVAPDVFIVAPDGKRFADLAAPVHPDRHADLGAIGGIHAALAAAAHDRVLVVACDLPFLEAALLEHLVALAATFDVVRVRSARGPEPLLACYRRTLLPAIEARIARGQLAALALGEGAALREVGPDELAAFGPADRLVANINTPDDYARLQ